MLVNKREVPHAFLVQINRDLCLRFIGDSFFQIILPFTADLSLMQVVLCHGAAVKCLPIHHYSTDYMFLILFGTLV